MASPPNLYIEALNDYVNAGATQSWTDITTAVHSVAVGGIGWTATRNGTASVGKMVFTLVNASQPNAAINTLNGAINSVVTTINVSVGVAPIVGQIIVVDSEYMQVTTVVSNSQYIVVRGVKGTQAASHSNGASVLLWQPLYMPRSAPGTYTYAQSQLIEDQNRVRIRYAGLNNGRCMKAYVTSASGSPTGGTISQSNAEPIVTSQVWTLTYQARAQYDYQGNVDSIAITTDSGAGTLDSHTTSQTYTNKWATYSATLSTTQTAAHIVVNFSPYLSCDWFLHGDYYFEYRNVTLTCPSIAGGANQIQNGTFSQGNLGATPTSWTKNNGDAGATVVTALNADDTFITFYGRIEDIAPPAFYSNATAPLSTITCSGLFDDLQYASLSPPPPIQHNVSLSTLVTTALSYATRSWPGQTVDTARLTPPGTSFDKYTSGLSMVSKAIDDVTISEFGHFHVDRDGTFVWHNRDYEGKKSSLTTTIALTIADNQPYNLVPSRNRETITNRINVTFHPRTLISPLNPVFIGNTPIQIPANGPNAPGTLVLTCQYHDLYGRQCGADNIRQLVPFTAGLSDYDYKVNEFQDGTGIDYTTNQNLTVSMNAGASQAVITFSNTATGPLWIQSLRIMGRAITTYDIQTMKVSDGVAASGTINATTLPVNNDTVVVNGITFTFKTALTPAAGEVLIGATAYASMKNLWAAMTGATGAGVQYANLTTPAPATAIYAQPDATHSNRIIITFGETGTSGNAFTLARTGTGGAAVSGATLTGGASVSKTRFGLRDATKDLPFTDDPVFVMSLCQYLINRYAYPFLEFEQMEVQNEEQINSIDLLSLEVGDVIAITNLQNAMYAARHWITNISYELDPMGGSRPLKKISFLLARLDNMVVAIWSEVSGSTWNDGVSVTYI